MITQLIRNQWESLEITGNHWNSLELVGIHWNSLKLNEIHGNGAAVATTTLASKGRAARRRGSARTPDKKRVRDTGRIQSHGSLRSVRASSPNWNGMTPAGVVGCALRR